MDVAQQSYAPNGSTSLNRCVRAVPNDWLYNYLARSAFTVLRSAKLKNLNRLSNMRNRWHCGRLIVA
jgi:hypothetical protein